MTKRRLSNNDIIRLTTESLDPIFAEFGYETSEELRGLFVAIATEAAAQEREACAKLFDGPVWAYDYREIAARIRARKTTWEINLCRE